MSEVLHGTLIFIGTLAWLFGGFYAASVGWHAGKPKWARSTRETRIERVDALHIGENVTPLPKAPDHGDTNG